MAGAASPSRQAPRRLALRARLAVWGFVAGALIAAGAMWSLRGQHAALPAGPPSTSAGSAPAVPTSGVAAEANDLELRFSGWTALFRGIAHGHGESPMGKGGMMKVNALRIDLDEPGVSLHATHGNGDAPLETTGESTLDFLERNGLSVAVNTHFFSPCCEATPEPKDLVGLAVSGGELVSPPVKRSGTGACTLVVTFDRQASVLDAPAPEDLTNVDVAVAGSDILLRDGAIVAPEDEGEGFRFVHPRTAAGVSADGRALYLLTIDGRQIGWSNGATLRETAAWLRFIGADDGLNLDGGGSTTMVRAEAGKGVLLNRPVGLRIPGTLRWNGSNLGAVGAPLPE